MSAVKASDSSAESQDWRAKYLESLRTADAEERHFRAVEAALKRMIGRLCVAALGQSSPLDEELKKLQAAVRGELKSNELEQLAAALTDIIATLDEPSAKQEARTVAPTLSAAPSQTEPTLIGEDRLRALFSTLLSDIRRDPELTAQADSLDAKLSHAMTRESLPDVFSSLTELVTQRIQHIELAKQEVEALLSQMAGKLDEIGQSMADQAEHHNQSLASSETLNTHLASEVKAMGESVESVGDLHQLRLQVRGRLESIDRHMHEFRQREADLTRSFRASQEKMSARVAELEAEASRLNSQLKDEQRTAYIDTLTQIPNRLAYDKRMEEELRRWQRFKQPTCVAAWDIDYFKRINDTYGHRAGDGVLRAVADCLAGRIRNTDFLARYGGEEFVMILTGTKLDDAVRLTDLIRIAVSKLKMHFRGTPLAITVSVGVTALLEGDLPGMPFERADKALYQAKERGRNCCVSG